MSNNRGQSGNGINEQKKRSSYCQVMITHHELATLKSVLYGYPGFLSHIGEPKALETRACLQAIMRRLPDCLEVGDTVYFEYEERVAILEAVIGFKLLLVTAFPQTAHRDVALADVEQLYQCLVSNLNR
jgi:hypothetical protein